MLCGVELVVVVIVVVVVVVVVAAAIVVRSDGCVFKSRRVVVITSRSPIWEEVSVRRGYLLHIVKCSLCGFSLHAAVAVTTLNTKELAH
jgi:hypothetical protein